MTKQPEKKRVPWWLKIDLAIILVGLVIMAAGALIVP
jgi:hypothetical protein